MSFLTGLAACMSILGYNSFKGLQSAYATFSLRQCRVVPTGEPRRGVECQERSAKRAWLLVVWGLEESLVVAVQVGDSWYSIQMWKKHH